MDTKILEELTYHLTPEVVGFSQHMVEAGTEAYCIYIVVDGQLDVYITNNG